MGYLRDNLYKMTDRCRMRSGFEGFEEFKEFESLKGWGSVPCSVFCVPRCGYRRFLQVVDFSDGFVIGKNRIVNEAVTW